MKPTTLFASCALALTSATGCLAAPVLNDTVSSSTLGHFNHTTEYNVSSQLSGGGGGPIDFWNCRDFDDKKAGFIADQIYLSPNPPVHGQDLEITIKGDLRVLMDKGAKVVVKVWKFGHAWKTLTFDWCENIQGISCPIQPGPVTFSKTQDLDRKIPPWTYELGVETFDANNKRISCLLMKTKVHN